MLYTSPGIQRVVLVLQGINICMQLALNSRYEGRIVQQLIRNAGGVGDYKEVPLPALEIWDALLKVRSSLPLLRQLRVHPYSIHDSCAHEWTVIECGLAGAQGKADATWVFLGHEGVQARKDGIELNIFKLADYGIPYGFTPILVANPETIRCVHLLAGDHSSDGKRLNSHDQPCPLSSPCTCHKVHALLDVCTLRRECGSTVKAFLRATARGYEAAAADPQKAASLLVEESKGALDAQFAQESQEFASKVWLLPCGDVCHLGHYISLDRPDCVVFVLLLLSLRISGKVQHLIGTPWLHEGTTSGVLHEQQTSAQYGLFDSAALSERLWAVGPHGARALADISEVAA